MNIKRVLSTALAAFGVGILANCAIGSPITYHFTVNGGPDGPLAGVIANGEFSYDSSIVVPGSGVIGTGLLSSLNFTWNGTTYSAATVNTSVILFYSTGDLQLIVFGTTCTAGHCSSPAGADAWFLGAAPGAGSSFVYSLPGQPAFNVGALATVSGPIVAVPEPASLALLALGLAGCGFCARRKFH